VAQAGNPERYSGVLGSTRTGMTWHIRETLEKGLAYGRAWMAYEKGERPEPPPHDPRFENFRGIAKGEIPVIVHTQNTMVLQSTIRLFHDELGVDCILSHASFDAYRNAALAATRGMAVNVGPRMVLYNSRDGRIHGLGAEWHRGGVKSLTINTDAPVVPQEDLVTQAAVAVRFGLPEDVALRGITIECAKQLKIDHRIGSLEVGKDADIVIHSGPPLDMRTRILAVFVNGKPVVGEGIAPPQRGAGPTLPHDHPDHD
jgi:imidazolonepropionase-like amidohydrolase